MADANRLQTYAMQTYAADAWSVQCLIHNTQGL